MIIIGAVAVFFIITLDEVFIISNYPPRWAVQTEKGFVTIDCPFYATIEKYDQSTGNFICTDGSIAK